MKDPNVKLEGASLVRHRSTGTTRRRHCQIGTTEGKNLRKGEEGEEKGKRGSRE